MHDITPPNLSALAPFALQELARRNLLDFCSLMDSSYESVAHTNLLIEYLEALERHDIDRLLVHMPPRHSKTYHVSERFPAWYCGRHPADSIILASYGSDLAETSSRRVRGLLQHERWPFKTRVSADSSAVNRWNTTDGGQILAVGVLAGATGHGAALLGIDDPLKNREEADSDLQRGRVWTWYTEVARTRLMRNAIQLVTSTRWHDDDLAGRILNSSEAKKWTVLTLPALCENEDDPIEIKLGRRVGDALWPSWHPVAKLEEQRDVMGSRAFASIYMQSPVLELGNIFKRAWCGERHSSTPPCSKIVLAVDAASKVSLSSDTSGFAVVGRAATTYPVLYIGGERLDFVDLERRIVALAERFRPSTVLIEEASSGIGVSQQLKRTTRLPIVGVVASKSKEIRAERTQGLFESLKVTFPSGQMWVDEFIDTELTRFPSSKTDDRVDALVHALQYLSERKGLYVASAWGGPDPDRPDYTRPGGWCA